MPGLPTGGIVSIPNEHGLQTAPYSSGHYFNFKVYYSDRDFAGAPFNHMYHVSMWVPDAEANKCKDMIKPGRFFRISAHLDARVKENNDNPFVQLRVDYKYFIPTKIGKIE